MVKVPQVDLRPFRGARAAAESAYLKRLRESPLEGDWVIVRGQRCPVAEDGSIELPRDRDEPHGDSAEPGSIPGLPVDVPVAAALMDLLRRVTGEPDMSQESLLLMIGDMLEEEPTDLLMAVGQTAPDQLGRVAQLMVDVSQVRAGRSGWAGSARSGAGRRPRAPRDCHHLRQWCRKD